MPSRERSTSRSLSGAIARAERRASATHLEKERAREEKAAARVGEDEVRAHRMRRCSPSATAQRSRSASSESSASLSSSTSSEDDRASEDEQGKRGREGRGARAREGTDRLARGKGTETTTMLHTRT